MVDRFVIERDALWWKDGSDEILCSCAALSEKTRLCSGAEHLCARLGLTGMTACVTARALRWLKLSLCEKESGWCADGGSMTPSMNIFWKDRLLRRLNPKGYSQLN